MLIRLMLVGVLAAGFALAQDDSAGAPSGGGRGGGRGGADMPMVPRASASPLDRLATGCNLSKDQRKQFSAILDAAHKSAADLRKQVPLGRLQVEAAIQAGKSPDEIKKLVELHGLAMAQMTQIEMKAFGDLYKLLDEDQKKAKGGQQIYNVLPGLFTKKNWND